MRTLRYTFLIILAVSIHSFADTGKVVLKNGNCFVGDLNKQKDGSCWIYDNKCMVKFSKNEIKTLVIYSKSHEQQQSEAPLIRRPRINQASENESKYDEMISYAARKHNLDPALIKAVVKAESNFNVRDISSKGARGLMQLMPDTAKGLGVKNSYEPSENINGGAKYLRYMLELFDWDLENALAAYNAGPYAVYKYNDVPPYRETKGYIKNVYNNYQNYRHSDKIYTYTDEKGCINIYNLKRNTNPSK
jgi:hypothetical protein